ncbi:class I SAM-dependent methyltransferase [Bradyrhizobium sp. TZ2]
MRNRFLGIGVQGLEGSRQAARIARNRGLDVHQGLVGREDLQLPVADLLINILVLEHIEDPIPYLETLRRACTPDGRAIFIVPLQDLGGYDLFFDEHVWHLFTPHFRALLERAGWRVLAIDGADPVVQGLGLALCTPAPDRIPPAPGHAEYSVLGPAQERNRDVWLRRFEEVNRRLAAFEGQPLIVFGSGEVFSLLRAYTDLSRANILGCLDEDATKIGSQVHGIEVHGLDWLDHAPPAPVFVTVNPRYNDAIQKKLEHFGRPLVFWGNSW